MEKQVRVLQISVGGNEFTGIASFLLQYYRSIDHDRIRFDFLFCKENSMKLIMDQPVFADSQFITLNATRKNSSEMDYFLLMKKLAAVLRENQYDAVHINTTAMGTALFCMLTARLCGVKTVISHSHNTKVTVKRGTRKRKKLLQQFVNMVKGIIPWLLRTGSHGLFACSESAGETLFGVTGVKMEKFHVIRNAIVARDYCFSPAIRNDVRREMKTGENTLVLGHVGRMAAEKNHLFLIDIFRSIHNIRPDSQLWLIGQGEDKKKIEDKIRTAGLSDAVIMLGQKSDVYRYMQGMDVFVFPSVSEGLGMVAIEAQAAGLPTYASDTIPRDTCVTDLIRYLSLQKPADEWAARILADSVFTTLRRDTYQEIADAGYDVLRMAEWLEKYYLSRVSKTN